ncbi:aminotransferase class V-fold PLP-dependent enzyme [Microscilla marina]|uniref:Isopenicillin N epimerase, putative n=1 Tax=Microscilla marina ATCC 23134 TaxID=313606 RepID=A1ZJT3_MICM2|nr:aminotransferase class V-fold PLP-dependent enzyme [Microscilla marina]EAY29386.1 isopenicillin N epimerase, putative [Microscilla marina ATCC 23134]
MNNKNRRNFIKRLTATLGTFSLASLPGKADAVAMQDAWQQFKSLPEEVAVTNEKLWQQIKQAFSVSSNLLYLNSAGLCPQPKGVQQTVESYNKMANGAPTYYANRMLRQDLVIVKQKLADLAGCDSSDIALQANTIMAMYHVIFGLNLQPGDEIILTKQDYSSVKIAYEQLAKRDKIKLVWLDLDLVESNEAAIVEQFAKAITPRTRLINITHMINWTGLILPVKKICDVAREKNVLTLVDGAQTFAHLDFNIPDLGCDFFATSLHKWLCAPFGTGMLYGRKSSVAKVYPLYGAPDPTSDNVGKFEHVGTIMTAAQLGISSAIDFHHHIGSALKEKRLRYLKNYWIRGIKDLPGVQINTPTAAERSCGVAHFSYDKMTSYDLSLFLSSKHRIHALRVNLPQVKGIRVSPNVFTTTRDLDRLIKAMHKVAKV